MLLRRKFDFIGFVVAFALVLALPTVSTAQNLLVNGDFATDLSGWQFPDATPTWSSFDADGAIGSGSAHGTNAQAGADARVFVLRQCVPISQPGLYVFGASGYTPSGQVAGDLVANYFVTLNSDCSGDTTVNTGGFFLPGVDQWQAYTSGTLLNIPPQSPFPAMAIRISLGVDKSPAGGSFAGYFDNVFLIRDPIFSDGFEP
ncbi:MAG: hypothetical protein WBV39_12615 [Rudaea sp.]